MKHLGSKGIRIAAYHPKVDYMEKKFHSRQKSALRAMLRQSSWLGHLPLVLLGLCRPVKDDIQCSFSEMVYGTPFRLTE